MLSRSVVVGGEILNDAQARSRTWRGRLCEFKFLLATILPEQGNIGHFGGAQRFLTKCRRRPRRGPGENFRRDRRSDIVCQPNYRRGIHNDADPASIRLHG